MNNVSEISKIAGKDVLGYNKGLKWRRIIDNNSYDANISQTIWLLVE